MGLELWRSNNDINAELWIWEVGEKIRFVVVAAAALPVGGSIFREGADLFRGTLRVPFLVFPRWLFVDWGAGPVEVGVCRDCL